MKAKDEIQPARFTILSLDPGVTTGYAYGEVNDGVFRYVGAGQHKLSVDGLWRLLEGVSPLYILAESFEFRQQQRDGLVLYSRNLLGVSELWCKLHDAYFYEQSASVGKGYYSDDQLRNAGVYLRGRPHANDAIRHLLHWTTFRRGSEWLARPVIAQ